MSDEDPQPSPDSDQVPETPPAASGGVSFTPATIEELNAILPQYEFVEMIGVGGMGAVYKARQPKLNRFVAIKILPPIPDDELAFAERFEREAQSMASLSHPHIVPVYDFGETSDGQLYFVMEYIEGADLHQLITGGQLTTDHFFGWVPQICDAIQFAHDHGIVHRDIKPANILIDKHGRVRMADFGLAKLTDTNEPQTALTLANISMGTPDYAAPEQIDPGQEIDWRADIYSLGVVMYQMLTGRVPRGAFPMPSEKTEGLDHRVDEVVLKAMQSNPADRFQRASDITSHLTNIHSSPQVELAEVVEETSAEVPAEKKKPKSLMPAVLGLVGASMLLGLVLIAINRKKNPGEKEPGQAPGKAVTTSESGGEKNQKPAESQSERKPDKTVAAVAPKPEPAVVEERPKPPIGRGQGGGKLPGDGLSFRPGPGKFASFKDKLGPRGRKGGGGGGMPEGVRRTAADNLLIARLDGGPAGNAGVSDSPPDLKRVLDVKIGQGPVQANDAKPFVVALQGDGSVVAWGDNAFGKTEVPDEAGSRVVQIAAGANHALALRRDGEIVAWGRNDSGQCDVPVREDLGKIEKIVAGSNFSAALRVNGTVAVWGAETIARGPDGLEKVADIEAGYQHIVALREDGTVVSWGSNDFAQLEVPAELEGVVDIAVTFGTSYALLDDGHIVGWGGLSGKRPVPPEIRAKEIEGSGDFLVIRDDRGRPFLVGQKLRAGGSTFLRQAPPEVKLQFSAEHVLLLRPAPGESSGGANEVAVNEAGPSPPELAEPVSEKPETEASRRIADLQQKFEAAYLEQVDMPFEISVEQLNEFYLGAIEGKQTEAAAASRLEEAVALREESERIGREGSIPKRDAEDASDVLKELRQTYRSQNEQFESDRLVRESELLEKYDAALEALQNEFTQSQLLDEALEVKAFREDRTSEE